MSFHAKVFVIGENNCAQRDWMDLGNSPRRYWYYQYGQLKLNLHGCISEVRMLNSDKGQDRLTGRLNRRAFIGASVTAFAGFVVWHYPSSKSVEAEAAPAGQPKMVRIVEFSDAGIRQGIAIVPAIIKSEEEWRKQLTRSAFDITRKADTEMAFSGAYWNLHAKGLFRCICCDTALFSSETKFDSGTGWPSFWAPIAEDNVRTRSDFTLLVKRTEVHCTRCDAHLGHVFDDGPKPTGLRYCMNSASLRFVKAT